MSVLLFCIRPGITAVMQADKKIQVYKGKVDINFTGVNTITRYLVGVFHGVKVWLVVGEKRMLV